MARRKTPTSLEDGLQCLICQNVYSNPHTVSCGHSFCLHCIESLVTNRCPTCLEKFTEQYIPSFGLQRLCDLVKAKGSSGGECAQQSDASIQTSVEYIKESHCKETNECLQLRTILVCPVHDNEEAEQVCTVCTEAICSFCIYEGLHEEHIHAVVPRLELLQRLEKAKKELHFAGEQAVLFNEILRQKEELLRSNSAVYRQEIEAKFDEATTKLLSIIGRAKFACFDQLDRLCQEQCGESLQALLNLMKTFKDTFTIYGNIKITTDNCLSVLRKFHEMETMLSKIEEQRALTIGNDLSCELPTYDKAIDNLGSWLQRAAKEVHFDVEISEESAHTFTFKEPEIVIARTLPSPEIACPPKKNGVLTKLSIIENKEKLSSINTLQIVIHENLIYVPSWQHPSHTILIIDIPTGTVTHFTYRSLSKRRLLPQEAQQKTVRYSLSIGKDSTGTHLLCVGAMNVPFKEGPRTAVEVLKVKKKGGLGNARCVELSQPCGLCFGREFNLYFLEKTTGNVFQTGEKINTKKLTMISCIARRRISWSSMSFDSKCDRLWIQTGQSQLTQVTLSGEEMTFEVNECVLIGGIAVDSDSLLWVTDSAAAKLLVYRQVGPDLVLLNDTRLDIYRSFNIPAAVAVKEDRIVVMDKEENGSYRFHVFEGVLSFHVNEDK